MTQTHIRGLTHATISALAKALEQPLILPGPLAGRQDHWKERLPWRLKIEYNNSEMVMMRDALGVPDGQGERWDLLLEALRQGILLVRVIRLHHRYRVAPGDTRAQRQARLTRWLPKPFYGDGSKNLIGWKTPVRFASFFTARSMPATTVTMLIGPVTFDAIWSQLRETGKIAHWGDGGRIYILVTRIG